MLFDQNRIHFNVFKMARAALVSAFRSVPEIRRLFFFVITIGVKDHRLLGAGYGLNKRS